MENTALALKSLRFATAGLFAGCRCLCRWWRAPSRRRAGDDAAVAFGALGGDGGGQHGRPDIGDGADCVIPACMRRGSGLKKRCGIADWRDADNNMLRALLAI